jgi:hypothetical protein
MHVRSRHAVPTAKPVGDSGLCWIENMDYSMRWDYQEKVHKAETQIACANSCMADSKCRGATYISFPTEWGVTENCWHKSWPDVAPAPAPCFHHAQEHYTRYALIKPPPDTNCADIKYKENSTACEQENAEAEEAALGTRSSRSQSYVWAFVSLIAFVAVMLMALAVGLVRCYFMRAHRRRAGEFNKMPDSADEARLAYQHDTRSRAGDGASQARKPPECIAWGSSA